MSRKKDDDLNLNLLISKETAFIWNGNYSEQLSTFREKVDKVVRESGSIGLKEVGCNVTRIKKVWEAAPTQKLVEECKSCQ